MLPERIIKLKEQFIAETNLVEKMIRKSIEGLMNKDESKLNEVREVDEPALNKMEVEIEEMCIDIIALFHPEAIDLRTVLMILKMNNDFERIGDLAVNIAQSSAFLIQRPDIKPLVDLPKMAEEAVSMLRDCITAFTEKDTKLAKEICERDDIVDNLGVTILKELIEVMSVDPAIIERAMHILRIAKNVERIADHSTNISEDVIFMAEGRVIKHGTNDPR